MVSSGTQSKHRQIHKIIDINKVKLSSRRIKTVFVTQEERCAAIEYNIS